MNEILVSLDFKIKYSTVIFVTIQLNVIYTPMSHNYFYYILCSFLKCDFSQPIYH